MRLRNINPLGAVDLPLIGRTLEAGEEFDVDDEHAGAAPSESIDPETGDPVPVPGHGLLAQVGNFEVVDERPLESLSKNELQSAAAAAGVEVARSASKADIIAALEAHKQEGEGQ